MAAQSRVERGHVSRARHELTKAPLAPKNQDTLNELQGRRPQERVSAIPQEVLDFRPEAELQLDAKLLAKVPPKCTFRFFSWRGGCTYEMIKVCLDDWETLQLLTSAAEDFARGTSPEVSKAFFFATFTALQKKDGGVRGIATGSVFRRLVAKTLAKQFSSAVETACAPFQFALSTRANTDCVGHALRAATDMNPQMTVLSNRRHWCL